MQPTNELNGFRGFNSATFAAFRRVMSRRGSQAKDGPGDFLRMTESEKERNREKYVEIQILLRLAAYVRLNGHQVAV